MIRIKVVNKINKKAGEVFKVVKDFKKYADFISGVKQITELPGNGNILRMRWQVDFDGAPFEWTEEEIIHKQSKTISFKALEGDFYIYCGEWRIEDTGDNGSNIKLEAYFDWGVPNMEKHVGAMLERKAKKALKGMVLSLKRKCENG
ncbi:MAG: SRPBCC family protein [Candidatus Omnitrophica bacterium]|nr:SRPBCC family protein [Candidatus Omnitrophota bacterium]MBU1128828.1 SRPBCC family protein [Candidatus Omnitrophota bacterium]MBU1657335.1 SRPBCC family protein [Candidatus Omnitrophota bacterium]MBU1783779.1 SRPBCC family protein [Candidatus Omnitrophota bacterium]MBU1852128.1 SRPBCC family protein [Candidatus Omnitrophota bacterium]